MRIKSHFIEIQVALSIIGFLEYETSGVSQNLQSQTPLVWRYLNVSQGGERNI